MRVAREAIGADGQVVPQQWLAHTTAPNVDPADRRRLDLVIYGAKPLVSPLTRTATDGGRSAQDGRATQARRVPEAQRGRRACGPGHRGRGPVERGSVAPRARSGPDQGPVRPARPPHCCQGRLVAKVVVPIGDFSAAGRCCQIIGQHVVGELIAAAVDGRRPRHMLQTQKSPRNRCVLLAAFLRRHERGLVERQLVSGNVVIISYSSSSSS